MKYLLFGLLLACAGCGSRPAETSVVTLDEIPPDLIKVAEKALPKVKLEHARRMQVNGEEVFQIRGKLPSGKIREVEVSASGKVVDTQ